MCPVLPESRAVDLGPGELNDEAPHEALSAEGEGEVPGIPLVEFHDKRAAEVPDPPSRSAPGGLRLMA